MSTNSILNIPYTYPAPTPTGDITPANNNVTPTPEIEENPTINKVYEQYENYFKENGIYDKIKGALLAQLRKILDLNTLTIDDLKDDKINKFYTDAQTFFWDKTNNQFVSESGENIETYRIDQDHCREGFMAYRFYLKEIATRIKAINESIIAGQAALAELTKLTGTSQQINNQAHEYITEIEIYDKFIYEELEKFLTYYKFNEDTKQWDITTLDVFETDISKNYDFSQLGEYDNYNHVALRAWENGQWREALYCNEAKNILYTLQSNKFEETLKYQVSDNTWYIRKNSNSAWKKFAKYDISTSKWTIYSYDDNSSKEQTENPKISGWYITNENKIEKDQDLKKPTIESKLQNLRELQLETINSLEDNGKGSMQLTSFNSLTLFDRLRYIRWYYKLMFSQTDGVDRVNSRFPDNNDTGYPCMPDIPSIDDTKATQSLGALELFYVGYLINRDGPVNALSSFFEVKVNALRENVSLSSKKIEALNIYLDFINAGLDQLNKNNKCRATDGSIIALTYLCGQKMYNLYEYNGDKYLVLPSLVNEGQYFLVKNDENGKKWLVGDSTYEPKSTPGGNSGCYVSYQNGLWHATLATNHGTISTCGEGGTATAYCKYDAPSTHTTITIDDFKLPTQIECTTVAPSSVLGYAYAIGNMVDDKDFFTMEDEDMPVDVNGTKSNAFKLITDSKAGNTLGSWTDAFSRKTQYINTAIDTINTDVTLDRSKIDTFDSLTSTFRSRAQDTYQNIISNIR